MDYNARINWQPGQEITVQALRALDHQIDEIRRTTRQIAVGQQGGMPSDGGVRGLLPGTSVILNSGFVRKSVEITGLRLTAMLPSGRIVSPDEDVKVAVDSVNADELFVCIGIGNEFVEYFVDDVPLVRPKYAYSICTREEALGGDVLPILRMTVADGSLEIDHGFEIPTLNAFDSHVLTGLISEMQGVLADLSEHANLEASDLKFLLIDMAQRLSSLRMDVTSRELILSLRQLAMLLQSYAETYRKEHELSGEAPAPVDSPEIDLLNVAAFCAGIRGLFKWLGGLLDVIIVPDRSIDFDALKAQLREELFDTIRPEVEQKLVEMREQLHTELLERTETRMREIIDDTSEKLHRQLGEELSEQLKPVLYDNLYQPLYDALFDALYLKNSEDEKMYVPQI